MIHREYKSLKLFIVIMIALLSVWQGKRNLSGFVGQVSAQDCSANWFLVECE